jgi:hypothetical protein
MRTLLKMQMDVEAGNRAIRDGSFGRMMDRVMQEIKPEAAYFTAIDGKRTGLIVFDLDDPKRIPSIAEPFFMTVGASIDFMPVMNAEEVRAGIEAAAPAFAATP